LTACRSIRDIPAEAYLLTQTSGHSMR
jgi:hypothetical protein